MKKVFLLFFIGIFGILMAGVSFMNFNPKIDTWSSLFAGAALGLLIVKSRTIITYFKNRKQKTSK